MFKKLNHKIIYILQVLILAFFSGCMGTAGHITQNITIPSIGNISNILASQPIPPRPEASLLSRLGTPAMQRGESGLHQLQYRTETCVLDIFITNEAAENLDTADILYMETRPRQLPRQRAYNANNAQDSTAIDDTINAPCLATLTETHPTQVAQTAD